MIVGLAQRGPDFWAGLRTGARHYDHGAFWHAHEAWEQVWRAYQAPDRHYLKGLIQLAAVGWHLQRGNRRAARTLLDRGLCHLERCDPLSWPFDAGHLLVVGAALARALDGEAVVHAPRLRLEAQLDAWLDTRATG